MARQTALVVALAVAAVSWTSGPVSASQQVGFFKGSSNRGINRFFSCPGGTRVAVDLRPGGGLYEWRGLEIFALNESTGTWYVEDEIIPPSHGSGGGYQFHDPQLGWWALFTDDCETLLISSPDHSSQAAALSGGFQRYKFDNTTGNWEVEGPCCTNLWVEPLVLEGGEDAGRALAMTPDASRVVMGLPDKSGCYGTATDVPRPRQSGNFTCLYTGEVQVWDWNSTTMLYEFRQAIMLPLAYIDSWGSGGRMGQHVAISDDGLHIGITLARGDMFGTYSLSDPANATSPWISSGNFLRPCTFDVCPFYRLGVTADFDATGSRLVVGGRHHFTVYKRTGSGATSQFVLEHGPITAPHCFPTLSTWASEIQFGFHTAISGDGSRIAVGWPADKGCGTGNEPAYLPDSCTESGSMVLYGLQDAGGGNTTLHYLTRFKPDVVDINDDFGTFPSLNYDGTLLSCNSYGEDSCAPAANSNLTQQQDNGCTDIGAGYLFNLSFAYPLQPVVQVSQSCYFPQGTTGTTATTGLSTGTTGTTATTATTGTTATTATTGTTATTATTATTGTTATTATTATTGAPTTGVPTTGVPTTGVPTTGVSTTGIPTTGFATTAAPAATTGSATTAAPAATTAASATTTAATTTGVATTTTAVAATTGGASTGVATSGSSTTAAATTGSGTTGATAAGGSTTGAPCDPPRWLSIPIASGDDDGELRNDRGQYCDSSDLEIMYDDGASEDQPYLGFRFFPGINASTERVLQSWIRLRAENGEAGDGRETRVAIHAELSADPAGCTGPLYGTRPRTTALEMWDGGEPVGRAWTPSEFYNTPDLSRVINEVLENEDVTPSSGISIIFRAIIYGWRKANSFESTETGAQAPRLEIQVAPICNNLQPTTGSTGTTGTTDTTGTTGSTGSTGSPAGTTTGTTGSGATASSNSATTPTATTGTTVGAVGDSGADAGNDNGGGLAPGVVVLIIIMALLCLGILGMAFLVFRKRQANQAAGAAKPVPSDDTSSMASSSASDSEYSGEEDSSSYSGDTSYSGSSFSSSG